MGWKCPNCDILNPKDYFKCVCGYEADGNETQEYSKIHNLSIISRKHGCLIFFILFVLFILFLFIKICTVNLSQIEGTVYYSEINNPVQHAYVICFYYKYPLIEAINVGGANSDLEDVEIVKTDENGLFTLSSYRAISLRMDNTREFLIYKPGHSVLRYFQANSSLLIDMNNFPWMNKIKAKKTFIIPKEFDNENNNIVYVAGDIERFASHFKYEDNKKYMRNLKMFREIYVHLMNDSERFVNSKKTNENARENWKNTMIDLRYYLGLEQ